MVWKLDTHTSTGWLGRYTHLQTIYWMLGLLNKELTIEYNWHKGWVSSFKQKWPFDFSTFLLFWVAKIHSPIKLKPFNQQPQPLLCFFFCLFSVWWISLDKFSRSLSERGKAPCNFGRHLSISGVSKIPFGSSLFEKAEFFRGGKWTGPPGVSPNQWQILSNESN